MVWREHEVVVSSFFALTVSGSRSSAVENAIAGGSNLFALTQLRLEDNEADLENRLMEVND